MRPREGRLEIFRSRTEYRPPLIRIAADGKELNDIIRKKPVDKV